MSARLSGKETTMGKNPVVAVVAVIIIVVAIILMFRSAGSGGPGEGIPDTNWYDTGTSELYGRKEDGKLPPVPAASGKEGVRAHVFSCTNCSDKSSRFIGYLEKFTDEAKATIAQTYENQDMGARNAAINSALIRGEKDTDWVAKNSPEGEGILAGPAAECGGQPLKVCGKYMP